MNPFQPFNRGKKLVLTGMFITAILISWLWRICPWLHQSDSDLLLRLRGNRQTPEEFLWVYLDENDIRMLGGWPVTWDYYGYFIHLSTEKNARVIGLDILLDSPNRMYPEYSRILADFAGSSGRVVLPNVIENLEKPDSAGALNPLPELLATAAAVGFSNLESAPIQRNVPVVHGETGSDVSLGLALAKTYFNADIRRARNRVILNSTDHSSIQVPVDSRGGLWMNPLGDPSVFHSMSLTDLFRMYEQNPDSVDFSGQMVLLSVTAPGLPVVCATPLCPQMPGSLVHLNVAENVIHQTWLRPLSILFMAPLLLFWMIAGMVIGGARKPFLWWIGACLLLTTAAWAFISVACVVVPFGISWLVLSGFGTLFYSIKRKDLRELDRVQIRDIEKQINLKEAALSEAEIRLNEAENRLRREIAERAQLSEETQKLAAEKEETVLELEKQIRDLKAFRRPEVQKPSTRFREIIHAPRSPFSEVLRMVEKVAEDDIPVLIQGETGTGKELIARAIHQAGHRQQNPFVAVNCGALSESLLESELFGHEKGAFTGAQNQRKGRFELACGGTLFLDEITETTAAFQAKLLRVLQEGIYERVGGERSLKADVRVITAHNKNIESEIREKRFRQDLYFRLKGFPIFLPPLRNRPDDIPLLTAFFITKYSRGVHIQISEAAAACLGEYRWPGNVRELENTLRRAVVLLRSDARKIIQMKDLPEEIRSHTGQAEPMLYHPLETQILETLRTFQFSHSAISQTARALGNRDRGTVTEYFRGLCFQFLAENSGDMRKAASALAASDDTDVIGRVEGKMRDYMNNVHQSVDESPDAPRCYKGLPKKFHPYLDRIIQDI